MSDDSTQPQAHAPDEQQAFSEAKERQRRLQTWLKGMLAGGPALADATKEWRQGLSPYGGSGETSPRNQGDVQGESVNPVEDSLMEIRRRIRERRELRGKLPLEIDEEEYDRRSAQVIAAIQTDRAKGIEPTPLHLVLAARYVEGEIDFEEYQIAVRRV